MIPYSYNMVDMGGIDLAEANGTVVPGVYEKIVEAMNLCGDVILYNWKFAGINVAPSAYTILQQVDSILINGLIQVTEQDELTILGINPDPVLAPLVVQENGVYNPPAGVDGFSPVTVNVSGSSKFDILNSSIVSETGSVSDYYRDYRLGAISRNQTGYNSYVMDFDDGGVHRSGYYTGGFEFSTRIQAGAFSKLYIDTKITQYGPGWRQAKVYLSTKYGLASGGDSVGGVIKTVWLATQDMTPEQINSQEGVVINSTGSYSLSRQTVEIDISSISDDFFIGFFNCDLNIWVYNIYVE